MSERIDWDALMRVGLGALALNPDVFWAMTPRELDAAMKGRLGTGTTGAAMPRGRFDELAARFPDARQGGQEI